MPRSVNGWLPDSDGLLAGNHPETNASLVATVNDYHALRDYLKKQKLPEFVLSFEAIEEILDASLPRAAQRASWWETLRQPAGKKMPQARSLSCRRLTSQPALPDGQGALRVSKGRSEGRELASAGRGSSRAFVLGLGFARLFAVRRPSGAASAPRHRMTIAMLSTSTLSRSRVARHLA